MVRKRLLGAAAVVCVVGASYGVWVTGDWLADETARHERELAVSPDVERKFMWVGRERFARPAWLAWLSPWLPAERTHITSVASVMDKLDEGDLAMLENLPHLKELNLGFCKFTPKGFDHIPRLVSLESLGLYGTPTTDIEIEQLATLRRLKAIDLSSTDVSDKGIANLLALRALEQVRLVNAHVSSDGIMSLRRLPMLKVIAVRSTDLPPALRAGFKNSSGVAVTISTDEGAGR